MLNTIDITTLLSTVPPYTVYVCDGLGNNCEFVAIFDTTPPQGIIFLPPTFLNAPKVVVKIIDGVNCEKEKETICST